MLCSWLPVACYKTLESFLVQSLNQETLEEELFFVKPYIRKKVKCLFKTSSY